MLGNDSQSDCKTQMAVIVVVMYSSLNHSHVGVSQQSEGATFIGFLFLNYETGLAPIKLYEQDIGEQTPRIWFDHDWSYRLMYPLGQFNRASKWWGQRKQAVTKFLDDLDLDATFDMSNYQRCSSPALVLSVATMVQCNQFAGDRIAPYKLFLQSLWRGTISKLEAGNICQMRVNSDGTIDNFAAYLGSLGLNDNLLQEPSVVDAIFLMVRQFHMGGSAFIKDRAKQVVIQLVSYMARRVDEALVARTSLGIKLVEYPTGFESDYVYGPAKKRRAKRADPQAMHQIAKQIEKKAGTAAPTSGNFYTCFYTNMTYYLKNSMIVKKLFDESRVISMTNDTARLVELDLLCNELAVASGDATYGFLAPVQVVPDLQVDLEKRSIGLRILDSKSREIRGERGKKKPSGDPLESTWRIVEALQNSLSLLPGGLMTFFVKQRGERLSVPGAIVSRSSRYV